MSSTHFISRYRENLDWLQGRSDYNVTYNFQGKFLSLEADDKELALLLAQRYGCFFSGENLSSSYKVKIKKNNNYFIFTDSKGKSSHCRHMGEVLYPYLAHTIDEIYETLPHYLAFHGSAFSTDIGGVLILGRAGSGKTSLVLDMIKRGYSYLSDDVSLVNSCGEKSLIPNPLGLKLRESALNSGNDSYLNPGNIENLTISSKCPLSAVILLTEKQSDDGEIHPACFSDYEDLLNEFIIPPSKRKSFSGDMKAFFDRIPLGVMSSSKEITIEKKAQNILDWLKVNMNATLIAG